jgi:hypothetical protein
MIIIFKYGNDYPTNLLTGSDNSMSAGIVKVEIFYQLALNKGFSGDLGVWAG